MRQIAVLPYRFGGPAQDGPTEILLITSRETKRWVVPKGNPLTGMTRHAAAAVEAEEEAGVIGAVCPTRSAAMNIASAALTARRSCIMSKSSRSR